MSTRRLAIYAAVVLAAATVGLGVPAAPAQADTCAGADGVTVLVDFNGLGGGVQGTCDADGGGKSASTIFGQAGFPLTYAQRQPGFVCRVSGVPTSDPCVNTSPPDAYWGLWWSDGSSGRWTYSTLGASSLTIPDGGYVGFSFDDVDGQAPPSATPTAHAAPPPSSSPTPSPDPGPSTGGSTGGSSGGPGQDGGGPSGDGSGDGSGVGSGNGDGGGDGGGGDGASGTPSAPGSTSAPSPSGSGDPSASASEDPAAPRGRTTRPRPGGPTGPSPSDGASPGDTGTPGEPDEPVTEVQDPLPPTAGDAAGDGLPVWLAPGLIALLFAAAGATVLFRRRTTGS